MQEPDHQTQQPPRSLSVLPPSGNPASTEPQPAHLALGLEEGQFFGGAGNITPI
ncbi:MULTISPECIES: hypothetical protein [unclassified Meiothermus]|uniref:hypothetical protein n=1 Tax=unclassified Meiothermus TaxID=370471 RepID=UPI001314290D|nr:MULTISPECIES: hypothetical protein [unclassified Meiothermus]